MDDKSRVFWSAFEGEFEKCARYGHLLSKLKWPLILGGAVGATAGVSKLVDGALAAGVPKSRMMQEAEKVEAP